MVWQEILKALASFIVGSVLTFLLTLLKKENKEQKALKDGMCSLLRLKIIEMHEKHEKKGFLPVFKKEGLQRMYESYHTLGGNDVGTKLYEDLINLPENKESNNE